MALIKKNLVLDHDYTKGTVKDYSGNSNDGAIQNAEVFTYYSKGNAVKPKANNAVIRVEDSSELQLTAGTFVIHGDFSNGFGGVGSFIDKRDAGGTNYLIFSASDTSFRVSDGATSSIFTLTKADYVNAKTLIITKSTGSSAPKLYIDGVYFGAGSLSIEFTVNDAPLFILNNVNVDTGDSFGVYVYSNLIYSDEKTADEVAQISKAVSSRRTPAKKKRSPVTLPDSSALNVTTGALWNMDLVKNKIIDQSNNHYDGTPTFVSTGTIIPTKTPWGEPAITLEKDTASHVTMGVCSNLNYTTQTFGGYAWVKPTDTSLTAFVFSNGQYQTAGYELFITPARQATFRINNAAALQDVVSSTVMQDIYYLVGFVSVAGDKNYIFMNCDEEGTPPTRVNPGSFAGSLRIGRGSTTATNMLGGEVGKIKIDQYASKQAFIDDMKKEWERVSRKVLYHEDFEDGFIHQAANTTVGTYLAGTELKVGTGRGQIIDGEYTGDKAISSGAFGANSYAIHDGYDYGTWVIRFKHVTGQRNILAIQAADNTYSSGIVLRYDTGGGNNRIEMIANTGTLLTGAIGGVSAGWHTLKIQKTTKSTNNVSVYLDGTLVTASAGSNPFTYTGTGAKYYVYGPYATGAISSVTHYFGIV